MPPATRLVVYREGRLPFSAHHQEAFVARGILCKGSEAPRRDTPTVSGRVSNICDALQALSVRNRLVIARFTANLATAAFLAFTISVIYDLVSALEPFRTIKQFAIGLHFFSFTRKLGQKHGTQMALSWSRSQSGTDNFAWHSSIEFAFIVSQIGRIIR